MQSWNNVWTNKQKHLPETLRIPTKPDVCFMIMTRCADLFRLEAGKIGLGMWGYAALVERRKSKLIPLWFHYTRNAPSFYGWKWKRGDSCVLLIAIVVYWIF